MAWSLRLLNQTRALHSLSSDKYLVDLSRAQPHYLRTGPVPKGLLGFSTVLQPDRPIVNFTRLQE